MASKYRNKKTGGFASKKEARIAQELQLLEKAGEISNLRFQVAYELLPNQRGPDGKVIERGIKYIADAVYKKDGKDVIIDIKGFRTEVYKIKKKLMLWFHKIEIQEE